MTLNVYFLIKVNITEGECCDLLSLEVLFTLIDKYRFRVII